MNIDNITIKKIVSEINTDGKFSKGGYWLPYFQRSFVWKEEQIYSLFDSIMRDYTIGMLLVWKTEAQIKYRGFTSNYNTNNEKFSFYSDTVNKAKYLVLDGQQRLQSLFLGLIGKYDNKILCFNVLSGIETNPNNIKYKFRFLKDNEIRPPFFSISKLIFSDASIRETRKMCIEECRQLIPKIDDELIEENIELLIKRFKQDEVIPIQEIDSIDEKNKYTIDDIVEIFIKCNSGGTILNKSDLLFSLLSVSWDSSYEILEELVEKLNRQGYLFTKDFILKSCLSIFKKGASYNVDKFKDNNIKKNIEENWGKISNAICDVKDYLYKNTYIRSDKALSSYLMLIPLIYFRYHYPQKWNLSEGKNIYILRSLLCKAFSGSPDNLIDNITKRIDLDENFILHNIFDEIRKKGRNLDITYDDILQEGYTTKNIHLIFNLLYMDFNYIPAFENNLPQLDHIFPVSLLQTIKCKNPETGKNIIKYKAQDRNQLANLMLLTREENGASGKSDKPPAVWFKNKSEKYLYENMIPENKELWNIENFELFIEARKQIIKDRLENTINAISSK